MFHKLFIRQRFFLFLAICGATAEARTVGFFYALDTDLQTLKKAGAVEVRTRTLGSTVIGELSLGGNRVMAVKMGSGCVTTAISAQALLAGTPCSLVISVGPAGLLGGEEKLGEWFLVREAVAWQRGSETETGFTLHRQALLKPLAPQELPRLPEKWMGLKELSVASGEVFIAADSFRAELGSRTKAAAVDMNLFGLLSVLESHGTPGLHFRIASDRADAGAPETFREFEKNYDGAGGKLAAEVIAALPEDKTSPEGHPGLRELLKGKVPYAIPQLPGPNPQGTNDSKDHDDEPARSGP